MFKFDCPRETLDWSHLDTLDLDAVATSLNVDALQAVVCHVKAAKLEAEDLSEQPGTRVFKLARALQMGLDFVGAAQSVQDVQLHATRREVDEARERARALAAENERLVCAVKVLKREANTAKRALLACEQLVAVSGTPDLVEAVRAVTKAERLRQARRRLSSATTHSHARPSAVRAMQQLEARVAAEVHKLLCNGSAEEPTSSEKAHDVRAISSKIEALSSEIDQRVSAVVTCDENRDEND